MHIDDILVSHNHEALWGLVTSYYFFAIFVMVHNMGDDRMHKLSVEWSDNQTRIIEYWYMIS